MHGMCPHIHKYEWRNRADKQEKAGLSLSLSVCVCVCDLCGAQSDNMETGGQTENRVAGWVDEQVNQSPNHKTGPLPLFFFFDKTPNHTHTADRFHGHAGRRHRTHHTSHNISKIQSPTSVNAQAVEKSCTQSVSQSVSSLDTGLNVSPAPTTSLARKESCTAPM